MPDSRVACPSCGREQLLHTTGTLYAHNTKPRHGTKCPASDWDPEFWKKRFGRGTTS